MTDFGIARIIDATTKVTSPGEIIGMPQYMAPERLEGGRADTAADIWALGATLYTAVEGIPPFDGPTPAAVIAAILTRTPLPPEHAGPLRELLGALLAKDPSQRPDAQTVARALARQRSGPTTDSWTAISPGTVKSGPPIAPGPIEEQAMPADVRSGRHAYPEQWYDHPRLDDTRGSRSDSRPAPDPRLESMRYDEPLADGPGCDEPPDDESWVEELRRSAPAYPQPPGGQPGADQRRGDLRGPGYGQQPDYGSQPGLGQASGFLTAPGPRACRPIWGALTTRATGRSLRPAGQARPRPGRTGDHVVMARPGAGR